jgi:uncharacterized protein
LALIVDAGALYAQADPRDAHHAGAVEVLSAEPETLVASCFAAAEADHLILTRLGPDAESLFLRDLADGTYVVECLTQAELGAAWNLANRYRGVAPGLADLSAVVLARRYRTRRLLTFDERTFRLIVPLQGGHFTILPADA